MKLKHLALGLSSILLTVLIFYSIGSAQFPPVTGGAVTTNSALTANLPVIGSGGPTVGLGSRSGNTTQFATVSGALTSGNCIKSDASGNLADNGATCLGATHTVTFSATPTFTATSAIEDDFYLSTALSANITSSTLSGATDGELLFFVFQQAAAGGPYTVAMPSGFTQACAVSPVASVNTKMAFKWHSASSTAELIACSTDGGPTLFGSEQAAPGTPPAGDFYCWADSTDHSGLECKANNSSTVYKMSAGGAGASSYTFGATTQSFAPPQGGWTIVNSAVLNNAQSNMLSVNVVENATTNWRIIKRATPGSTFTIAVTLNCVYASTSNATACGLYETDGTKLLGYELLQLSTALGLRVEEITNTTTDGSTVFGATASLTPKLFSACIVEDGTHRTFYHYSNGAWVQDLQQTTNTYLTPASWGVGGVDQTGSGAGDTVDVQLITYYATTGTACP